MSNTHLHFIVTAHYTLLFPKTSRRTSTQHSQWHQHLDLCLLACNHEMHCSISPPHFMEGKPDCSPWYKESQTLKHDLIEGSFLVTRPCYNVFVICWDVTAENRGWFLGLEEKHKPRTLKEQQIPWCYQRILACKVITWSCSSHWEMQFMQSKLCYVNFKSNLENAGPIWCPPCIKQVVFPRCNKPFARVGKL